MQWNLNNPTIFEAAIACRIIEMYHVCIVCNVMYTMSWGVIVFHECQTMEVPLGTVVGIGLLTSVS